MWVRNNKGNVFVGNLPPDFPDERLAETFDPYGIVLSAVVARDRETGARLRYGFVDIATERAATHAIASLDGREVDGCKLNVKPRDRTPKRPTAGPPPRRPLRQVAARAAFHDDGEAPRRRLTPAADAPRPLSQSQRARQETAEIEPPPRRDFEVVRKPLRRTTPSFQVERRSLPRRA